MSSLSAPRHPVWVSALLLVCLMAATASAQVTVEMKLSRRLYIVYEPILATVTITNLAGKDLELRDGPSRQWFGFEITTPGGTSVPPVNPDYHLDPIVIANGETVKRTVNVTELYQIREFGLYSLRAFVYLAQSDRYVTSRSAPVDITDGKVIFRQTVGVPPGRAEGSERKLSLLSHRLPKGSRIYARVEDPTSGTVYCTANLGRFLSFEPPKVVFDTNNEFHILQGIAPKSYMYTHLNLDGRIMNRATYHATQKNPRLSRLTDGSVQIVGGVLETTTPNDPSLPPLPKISDRPANLPKP